MSRVVIAHQRLRLFLVGIATCLLPILGATIGCLSASSPSLPYNLREVFQPNGGFVGAVIGAATLGFGVAAWGVAVQTPGRFRAGVLICLPIVAGASIVTYVMLAACVPVEALEDVVGTPVNGGNAYLERGWRWTGALVGVLACCALGIRVGLSGASTSVSAVLLTAGLAITTTYCVVVVAACTDNLIELLPARGASIRCLALAGWMVFAGTTAAAAHSILLSFVGQATRRLTWSHAWRLAVIVITVPLAWELVTVGLAEEVDKYGQRFSAVQFLLSASREDYAVGWSLASRFIALHSAVVIWLILCGVVAFGWPWALRQPFDIDNDETA